MSVFTNLVDYVKRHSTVAGPDGLYVSDELDKVSDSVRYLNEASRAYNPETTITTVANLPAAATYKNYRYMVTDANATGFWTIVAGGGANVVPVTSDGTNWRIG